MTLSDDFADADSMLDEAFGTVAATYTTEAGETTDLAVVKSLETDEIKSDEYGEEKVRVCHVSWSVSQLDEVDLRSVIAFLSDEDETWSIVQVVSKDPLRITVKLQRIERSELSRESYRRKM